LNADARDGRIHTNWSRRSTSGWNVAASSALATRSPASCEKDSRHQESDAIPKRRDRDRLKDPGVAEQHHASYGKKKSED
jgi:hypothetical protein